MRGLTAIAGVGVAGAITVGLWHPPFQRSNSFVVSSQAQPVRVRRAGINVGNWTSWGAEQLSSNVLKNPGFEGMVDGGIVVVGQAGGRTFTDSDASLARTTGFWNGAECNVRTGRSAGKSTSLISYRDHGYSGLPEFTMADDVPLDPGDVVAIRRTDDTGLPGQWWFTPESRPRVSVDEKDRRPGSEGSRSLALSPTSGQPVAVSSYLDAITDRAGKLLPVTGRWKLRFWTRLASGQATLAVQFVRSANPPFVHSVVHPSAGWQEHVIEWNSRDNSVPGILELRFTAAGTAGRVLLDDVSLQRVDSPPGAFRAPVLETLRRLKPGFLRDWQGQLGDNLANRLASPFGRRSWRYHGSTLDDSDFGYSIPEFLELCRTVHANPWLVVPVTLSDEEYRGFGAYLKNASKEMRFDEVLVEFGNENWNDIFRAAGIRDVPFLAEASDRAFGLIREGAGAGTPLKCVLGAQHANPGTAVQTAEVTSADIVALAPYFFFELPAGLSPSRQLHSLFTGDEGKLKQVAAKVGALHKESAVYEVNLHTLAGDASESERNTVIAGPVAATAVVKTVLDAYAAGVGRQCFYTLSGFDQKLPGPQGFARLFGLSRDLTDAVRLRPTGLAMRLLNSAVQPEIVPVQPASGSKDISVYAFRSAAGWSLAVTSASPETQSVSITLPDSPRLAAPASMYRLEAASPDATNEDAEEVKIVKTDFDRQGQALQLQMPAWGFAVILPQGVDVQ